MIYYSTKSKSRKSSFKRRFSDRCDEVKTIQRYNNTHVYSYDYHEALDDDKIVPFRPYVIQTEATMDGIVYDGKYYSLSDFGTNVYIHDTSEGRQ